MHMYKENALHSNLKSFFFDNISSYINLEGFWLILMAFFNCRNQRLGQFKRTKVCESTLQVSKLAIVTDEGK